MKFSAVIRACLVFSGLIASAPAFAQFDFNANLEKCTSDNASQIIEGCTNIIANKGSVRPQSWYYAHGLRALAWKQRGDWEKELADHNVALSWISNPADRAEVLVNRAGTFVAIGTLDKAQADIDEARRIVPRDKPNTIKIIHINQALVFNQRGQYDLAVREYENALRIDPQNTLALINRGVMFAEVGRFREAQADLNRALQIDPKSNLAYAGRSIMWRMSGNLEAALADANEAVRLSPGSPIAYIARAEMWRYRGDYREAIADFDRALQISPNTARAITGRGLAYEKAGDIARARQDYEKVLKGPDYAGYGEATAAKETAVSRLAALNSGAPAPKIAPVPARTEIDKLPTPKVAVPPKVEQGRAQGRRVALVIGNSAYRNVGALPNPHRDAEKVAATLKNLGFEIVSVAADADREKLARALRDFANEAENSDWAVVYYAGHGVEVNGVNYLVPVDAKLAVDRDVQFEAVSLDQVMTAVDGARKLKLVLLDACRNNPFTPQMRITQGPSQQVSSEGRKIGTRSIGRGLAEVKVSGATLVVYAAKHGQVAMDGEGENSPFAVAVVQRVATPGVEINKIFRLVRDDVMEATAGRQEPYTYGSLPGREDFFFVAR